ELVATHRSTGIPSVVAGIPLSRPAAALMRIGGRLAGRFLLRHGARFSAGTESRRVDEPSATLRSRAWAEAGDADGRYVAAMLETGEGYQAAAAASVRALEHQLQWLRPGAYTPVQAFGRDFAALVPGTSIQEL